MMQSHLQSIAIMIIPLLFAITLHEVAHGWIASKLGDSTAKSLGRLSLNPLKHIDIIGTIAVPIALYFTTGFIFGWAKPVPVNWSNLKHPRKDMAYVAIAGPAANLLMALAWGMIAKLSLTFFSQTAPTQLSDYLFLCAYFGIYINILLMVLNLIPIPPLDGSRLLAAVLPEHSARIIDSLEAYGIWIFILLLALGIIKFIILPPIQFILQLITSLFNLPSP